MKAQTKTAAKTTGAGLSAVALITAWLVKLGVPIDPAWLTLIVSSALPALVAGVASVRKWVAGREPKADVLADKIAAKLNVPDSVTDSVKAQVDRVFAKGDAELAELEAYLSKK